MPPLYGNSFGELTAASQNAQGLRQQAMQGAMQNFMGGAAQSRQGRYQDELLKQRKAESAAQNIDRSIALGLAYSKNKRDAEYQDWLMKQPTPIQEKERALIFDQATQDADTGMFDNPDHVRQMYPQLTKQDATVMSNRSKQARDQLTSVYDVASKAAKTLSMPDQIKKSLASVTQSDPAYFGGKEGQVAAIADLTDKLNTATQVAGRIKADKRLSQMIIYDPESNQYVPAVSRPRWLQVDQEKDQPDLVGKGGMIKGPKGGTASAIRITSSGSTGTAARPAAAPEPTRTGGQFDQQFYNRVNELIASGQDPVSAKRRAMAERSAGVP